MNFGYKRTLFLSLVFIGLIVTTYVVSNVTVTSKLETQSSYQLSGYTTSLPLIITNDAGLLSASSSGTGDSWSPYIIENLLIITTDPVGIQIGSTTKNFIIRDCYIEASTHGIYISSVANNTVYLTNNTIYNSGDGIHIESTNYVNVTKNYLSSNGEGIFLDNVDYSIVDNNTCTTGTNGIYSLYSDYGNYTENLLTYNTGNGIWLYESDNCNITWNECFYNENSGIYSDSSLYNRVIDNVCQNNDYHGIYVSAGLENSILFNDVNNNGQNGIYLHTSSQNEIINNTAHSNAYHGINLQSAFEAILANNTITNGGFHIEALSLSGILSLSVSSNLVNSKPLGFLYGLGEIILTGDSYGQLILSNCSGTMIQDYTIHDTSRALTIIGGEGIVVDNCDFDSNKGGGISLDNTVNCAIQNSRCSLSSGREGILTLGAINLTVFNCTTSDNVHGMMLANTSNFTISKCIFDNNRGSQISLSMLSEGNIINNSLTNGENWGLEFWNADYVNVSYNFFKNNKLYALFLDGSNYNKIHHNAFISNNEGGISQAYDNSANLNLWYDPLSMEGNYWDDWSGVGNYSIAGGFNNDTYPLGDIPPGVIISEFNQFSLLIFLLPAAFVPMAIIRKRKR